MPTYPKEIVISWHSFSHPHARGHPKSGGKLPNKLPISKRSFF